MLEENDNIKRHEKKGLRPLHDQSKGRNTECYLAFLTPPLASSCTIKAGSVAVSPNSDTIVEVIGHQSGSFKFKWTSVKSWPLKNEQSETLRNTDCVHKCLEINACLSPEFLCDGINHCPSGYDESGHFCGINSLLWILFGSIGLIIIIFSSLFYVIIQIIRKRPASSELSVNACSTIDGNETNSYILSPTHEIVSPIQEFEFQLNNQRSYERKKDLFELDTSQNYYRHAFQQTFQPFYQSRR